MVRTAPAVDYSPGIDADRCLRNGVHGLPEAARRVKAAASGNPRRFWNADGFSTSRGGRGSLRPMKPQPATYAEFVTQAREVLGLPAEPPPAERLNPALQALMNDAFALARKAPSVPPDHRPASGS